MTQKIIEEKDLYFNQPPLFGDPRYNNISSDNILPYYTIALLRGGQILMVSRQVWVDLIDIVLNFHDQRSSLS